MPAYDFDVVNEQSGETLEKVTLILPVDARDAITIRRRMIPDSVTIAGAAANPHDQAANVIAGYHRAEEKLGSRFSSSFSADEIKRAWSTPDSE